MHNTKIFAGNACPDLAQAVSELLELPLGKAITSRFSDGEIRIEIEENVRGRHVFLIQSTSPPTNDNLMELVIMVDALRRASAEQVTVVIPYFGYARQDRRVRSKRVAISAKVVADMMASVGIARIITVDLHADQIQGFFSMPVDNLYASRIILDDIQQRYKGKLDDVTVVSPDIGGVVRARAIAKRLNHRDLAIIDKRRAAPNEAQVMNIIGHIQDRHCILIDDIVDTAGTLCKAAAALKEQGAASVRAYCTHPILSGQAIANIEASDLTEMVVTNSIPLHANAAASSKIRVLSMASLIADAITRIKSGHSISSMFADFDI